MTELFQTVLGASVAGGIAIAVVLLLRPLMGRMPKKYTCLLWLLVGLRLLCPVTVHTDLSLQPDVTQVIQERQETTYFESTVMPEVPEYVEMPEEDKVFYYDAAAQEDTVEIDWYQVAAWVWLAGSSGLGLYSLISYLMLKRRVREAVRLDDGVFECPGLDTAFILGYFRPRIYVPAGLSPEQFGFILDHECTHLKRKDHWFKLFLFAALAVHWFNPLVWAAYLLLCRDIEMACDEQVVRRMDLARRKEYSMALLTCSAGRRSIAACPVAFGEIDVKGRIKNVLNYRKPAFWLTVIAVVVIIFVAVCFLTSPIVRIDPLTLEDWGITMTAVDPSATGVEVDLDIPENLDGNILVTLNDWHLQVSENGRWVDVPMLVEDDGLQWNGRVSVLFPNEDFQRYGLDWSSVYGEVAPGDYRIRTTLQLAQGGYGYQKEFMAEFTVTGEEGLIFRSHSEEMRELVNTAYNALKEFQSGEAYHVRVRRSFEGDLILNTGSWSEYYKSGERYYCYNCVEGEATPRYRWCLGQDGMFWIKDDAEVPAQWSRTDRLADESLLLPYLWRCDADAVFTEPNLRSVNYSGRVSFEIGEGDWADEGAGPAEVTFVLREDGTLDRVEMSFTVSGEGWVNGEKCTLQSDVTIVEQIVDEEHAAIEAVIEGAYQQANAG